MRATSGTKELLVATVVAISVFFASTGTVQACAVCFGDPNSQLTKAMAPGILFLLGSIGTVLGGFAALFCYWAMRMKRIRLADDGAVR